MKVIVAAIAALGVMSSFVGSASADVSINLSIGPSRSHVPSVGLTKHPSPHYQPKYYDRHYHSVRVRETYPLRSYRSNSYERHGTYQGNRYIIEKRINRGR